MRCQTTYIIQGGLILFNGLAYSSPYLFVALLCFTAPPVELGVRLLTNLICKSKVGNLHKHKAPSGRELARVARLRENAVL